MMSIRPKWERAEERTDDTEVRERTSQRRGWVVGDGGRKLGGLWWSWPIGATRSWCNRHALRRDVPMWPVAPNI